MVCTEIISISIIHHIFNLNLINDLQLSIKIIEDLFMKFINDYLLYHQNNKIFYKTTIYKRKFFLIISITVFIKLFYNILNEFIYIHVYILFKNYNKKIN